MSLGPNLPAFGTVTKRPDPYFKCPNCEGTNGTHTWVWVGFAADGPWVTRCDDCGYCDRCKRADA